MNKLIVGLGNYTQNYNNTRHNAGFEFIDAFCRFSNLKLKYSKLFQGEIVKFKYDFDTIFLLKPFTFMNNSKISVERIVNYYSIKNDDILIVLDDINISLGTLRAKEKGSSGGQKGLESIIDYLNTISVKRLRIGISKSTIDVVDYVLSKFTAEEQIIMDKVNSDAKIIINKYLSSSFEEFMSFINGRKYE